MSEIPTVKQLIEVGWMGGSAKKIHKALKRPLPDYPFMLFNHTVVTNSQRFHKLLIRDAKCGPTGPRQTYKAFGKTIRRLLEIDFIPLTPKQEEIFLINQPTKEPNDVAANNQKIYAQISRSGSA